MIAPELKKAARYLKDVTLRATGIGEFNRWRDMALENLPDRNFSSQVGSCSWGAFAGVLEIASPLIQQYARDLNSDLNRGVSLNIRGPQFLGSFALDVAHGVAVLALIQSGQLAEAGSVKLVYNYAAQIVPDALRSVRRNLYPPVLAL